MESETTKRLHWSVWISRLGLVLGALAVAMALIGAFGAGQGWWGKMDGLASLRTAFFIALVGLGVSLYATIAFRKKGKRVLLGSIVGLVLSGGYAAYIAYHIVVAISLPQIHDISTDLENPPHFKVLELRKDNWSDIPGRGSAEYAGMDARERWAQMHSEAYGDIRTVTSEASVGEVIARAEQLAKERGWDVAVADAEDGRLEATAEVSLIRFQDDVVLRVVPSENGEGSVIDMRSVSRLGRSDLGVNAERIRAFLADLKVELGR